MRDGFIFGGWFLEEDFSGNVVTEISSENSKGDVTVYALHLRLGFKRVSRFEKVGLKFGRWLDVVDYELLLS